MNLSPDEITIIKAFAVVIGGYALGVIIYTIFGDYDEF